MRYLCLLTLAALLMVSCSDDDDKKNSVVAPATYSFERDGSSTVSFSGQTARIAMASELSSAITDATSTKVKLQEMFANQTASGGDANPYSSAELNSSTKSVKSKVAASKDFFSANVSESASIKADFDGWLDAQVDEVFPNLNTLAAEGVAGQIEDGSKVRYVNSKGVEYNQMVAKSLIGALMADQILNNYLSDSVLDDGDNRANNDAGTVAEGKVYTTMEHKWDEAYGYLFGATADVANPMTDLGSADSFLNKYTGRVDGNENFTGIAQQIFDAFKLGRAAIVAKNYTVRDEQANIIRGLISKVIAVRAIHYLQAGKTAKEGGDWGGAFHDFSEGLGFVYSLRFTRQPNTSSPYFTRAEVDGFLNQLLAGNGLWDVTSATVDGISSDIAAKFDFTVEQAK